MEINRGWRFFMVARAFCTKPTTNGDIKPVLINRNPRNLERMRLARKPTGYTFEDTLIEYWHKLTFARSSKAMVAKLIHNTEVVVIKVSTQDWAIRKFLYSPVDTLACITLAKVFAERCMEAGINCCESDVKYEPDSKEELFLKTLLSEGFQLREPTHFNIHKKWNEIREKRPWTVLES